MKILVCGGRDYSDRDYLFGYLDRVHARKPINLLIQGGCDGADKLAKDWAKARRIHCAQVDAIWYPDPGGPVDRSAGPKRNRAMLLLEPDAVIAFPGGRGTSDMLDAAVSADVPHVWKANP